MKSFFLSLRSEFFKSRNTLAFWGAIILPLFLCTIVFLGYYFKADSIIRGMKGANGEVAWFQYLSMILGVMGSLLLPMYLIFMTYSVNNIEHKAETWKSLFSLPIPKFTVYASKALYTLLLVFISLVLFVMLSITYGLILGNIKPGFHFMDADIMDIISKTSKIYLKLFIASLGIISIQFFFSLIWQDFMKPMGLGFVLLVVSMIALKWEYSYFIPYSLPLKSIMGLSKDSVLFDKEALVSIAYALSFFTLGYFVVTKRSVK